MALGGTRMTNFQTSTLIAKKAAKNAINDFYTLYSGEIKKFKLFSIEHDKGRIILKLSSSKKNDNFIESSSRSSKITGGNNGK